MNAHWVNGKLTNNTSSAIYLYVMSNDNNNNGLIYVKCAPCIWFHLILICSCDNQNQITNAPSDINWVKSDTRYSATHTERLQSVRKSYDLNMCGSCQMHVLFIRLYCCSVLLCAVAAPFAQLLELAFIWFLCSQFRRKNSGQKCSKEFKPHSLKFMGPTK